MSTNRAHNSRSKSAKADASDRFSSALDELKSSFSDLRSDLSDLVSNTVDTGKSGAAVVKEGTISAMGDVQEYLTDAKDRSVHSIEQAKAQMSKHPLISSAIAVGIGVLIAKLLSRKS